MKKKQAVLGFSDLNAALDEALRGLQSKTLEPKETNAICQIVGRKLGLINCALRTANLTTQQRQAMGLLMGGPGGVQEQSK